MVIAASFGAKALFFIALSTLVYTSQSSEGAVEFFQLLFFQSVLISLLSSSGYYRAMNYGDDEVGGAKMLGAYFLASFVVTASLLLLCSSFLLAVHDYTKWAIIIVGAAVAAVSAPLSGIALQKKGAWAAFGPSIAIALVLVPLGHVAYLKDGNVAYVFLLIYQLFIFFILIYINRELSLLAVREMLNGRKIELLNGVMKNSGYGAINMVTLYVIYLFREYWISIVSADLAAAVLLVMRYSDTVMQFITVAMARSQYAVSILQHLNQRIAIVASILLITIFSILGWLAENHLNLNYLIFAVVCQILVDIFRIPQSLIFVNYMRRDSLFAFFLYAVPSGLIAWGGVLIVGGELKQIDMYLFMIFTSVISILITAILHRRQSGLTTD